MKRHADSRRVIADGRAGGVGFPVRLRLGPGAEVLGAGVPWQEPAQCLAGQGLSAVAAALVEEAR